MKSNSVLVIGDLTVDHILDLGNIDFDVLYKYRPTFTPKITTNIGGKGLSFAKAFSGVGFKDTRFLATVGKNPNYEKADIMGEVAINALKQFNIKLDVQLIPNYETGKVYYVLNNGVRILAFTDRGANEHLSLEKMQPINEFLEDVQLLYICGYTLFNDKQYPLIQNLINYANNLGIIVATEIVPHDIFMKISFEELLEKTMGIDYIEASIHTMGNFLQKNFDEKIIMNTLLKHYKYGFLYLGKTDTKSQFMASDGKITVTFEVSNKNLVGIADKVNAQFMKWKVDNNFCTSNINSLENHIIFNLQYITL